jgi:endonuclease
VEREGKMGKSVEEYAKILQISKNIILHGAPGTGKTFLARQIAANIVSNGRVSDYEDLSFEERKQVEFIQFHPNYDYTDFVEGLRPNINEDGTIGFTLRDGTFKRFVATAQKNDKVEAFAYWIAGKSIPVNNRGNKLTLKMGEWNKNKIKARTNKRPKDESQLDWDDLIRILQSEKDIKRYEDSKTALDDKEFKQEHTHYSDLWHIYQTFDEYKEYVFIIDEINRGEISKIFGELFFSIDPGYRGARGKVSTQYFNLHEDTEEKFYVPANVYIIGTMNDIDRSVDNFDFAMRRRFRFLKLRSSDRLEMLEKIKNEEKREEAISRMKALNQKISELEDLNENYEIGPAFFLQLDSLDFEQLWTDYLEPLIDEYLRGVSNESDVKENLKNAYDSAKENNEET